MYHSGTCCPSQQAIKACSANATCHGRPVRREDRKQQWPPRLAGDSGMHCPSQQAAPACNAVSGTCATASKSESEGDVAMLSPLPQHLAHHSGRRCTLSRSFGSSHTRDGASQPMGICRGVAANGTLGAGSFTVRLQMPAFSLNGPFGTFA